jgi:hypothetical protein
MKYYLHPQSGNLLTKEMIEEQQDSLLDDEGITGQKVTKPLSTWITHI